MHDRIVETIRRHLGLALFRASILVFPALGETVIALAELQAEQMIKHRETARRQ